MQSPLILGLTSLQSYNKMLTLNTCLWCSARSKETNAWGTVCSYQNRTKCWPSLLNYNPFLGSHIIQTILDWNYAACKEYKVFWPPWLSSRLVFFKLFIKRNTILWQLLNILTALNCQTFKDRDLCLALPQCLEQWHLISDHRAASVPMCSHRDGA